MEPTKIIHIKLFGPSDTGKTSLWRYMSKGTPASKIASTAFYVPGTFTIPLYEEDIMEIAKKKSELGVVENVDEWVAGYMAVAKTDYDGLEAICSRCNDRVARPDDHIVAKNSPYVLVQTGSADVGGQIIYDGSLEEACEYWINEDTAILACFRAENLARDIPDLTNKIGIVSRMFEVCGSHLYNKPLALVQTQTDEWPTVPKEVHEKYRNALYPGNPDKVPFIAVNSVEMPRKEVIYKIMAVILR